jgi:hypothetical protein
MRRLRLDLVTGLSSLLLDVYGDALAVVNTVAWIGHVRDVDKHTERPILAAIRAVTGVIEEEARRERNT